MLKNLIIRPTPYTPEIRFIQESCILNIKGESYPENAAEFYEPVFLWLGEYLKRPEARNIAVNIDLEYFNSSSSKILLDFFDLLASAADNGKIITVNWYYNPHDENTFEFGKDFRDDFTSLRFNLICKQSTNFSGTAYDESAVNQTG